MITAVHTVRQQRLAASPVIFRGAFRLLFLGSAVWALVVAALWVAAFTGAIELPTAMDPLAWHQHEMLFGFLGAAIAGFLSAAIPNWTGRPAFSGWRVAIFVGLWLAARLALLFSASLPALLPAVLDVGFLLLLAAAAGREVIAARNRNIPVVIVVLLFAAASALDHAEALGAAVTPGLGVRAGFALVLLLIGIIGGRIIPAFTRNWLVRHGRGERAPGPANWVDQAGLAALALGMGGWAVWPDASAVAILLLAAGALHALRLSRWSGLSAVRDPLVFILHVGYFWLPLGLLALGASILTPAIPPTVAKHALAAGCMATMVLAVMSRASLGHTGRPLVADRLTVCLYILVTAGAALRVAAPLLPTDYLLGVQTAGLLWGGAFLLFAIGYGPKLLGERADARTI